jgi:hypothetical protein
MEHIPSWETNSSSCSLVFLLSLQNLNTCQYIHKSVILGGGKRWRSSLKNSATTRRSQVRFPMMSLEFFILIIFPVAQCLTNVPPSHANCLDIWDLQTPRTLFKSRALWSVKDIKRLIGLHLQCLMMSKNYEFYIYLRRFNGQMKTCTAVNFGCSYIFKVSICLNCLQ